MSNEQEGLKTVIGDLPQGDMESTLLWKSLAGVINFLPTLPGGWVGWIAGKQVQSNPRAFDLASRYLAPILGYVLGMLALIWIIALSLKTLGILINQLGKIPSMKSVRNSLQVKVVGQTYGTHQFSSSPSCGDSRLSKLA